MKNVVTELYRAVVTVKKAQVSEDSSLGETLDITFTGQSRDLLRVLSETFAQTERDFAATLLHHALSETLKIMPDVLSDEEFTLLENRIIEKLGLTAYLSLQPIFPFEKGLEYPNFAEVATKEGIVIGQWVNKKDKIDICDPFTGKVLYFYPKTTKPKMSVDGMTLQWSGTNVKPLFVQPIVTDNFIEGLERTDILVLEGTGYFYREDEYLNELKFVSFSNIYDKSGIEASGFRSAFKVDERSDGVTIEPTSAAMGVAHLSKEGSWLVGDIGIRVYSSQNVIINPEG